MDSKPVGFINVLIVWGVASLVGFFGMAALMVAGDWTFLQAIFAAAVIFFVLGTLLSILFLRPLPGPVKPGSAGYAYSETKAAPAAEASAAAPKPAAAAEPAPAPAEGEGTKPAALSGPRGGKADDLKKIKGVGPKLEKTVNDLGYYHFDQIAAWTPHEVAWVDENLEGFKGRVSRDNWVEQAKLLASGGETEFSKRVDEGDVY